VFRFQKRLKEWIEVFAETSLLNKNLYGIIVGDGPLKKEIVDHIKAHGLESRIILPGLQVDVKPWLSTMDAFMMSSVFEGLPIAMLEAMSMECAILTTDAGGIKEVIEDEKNGLMVSFNEWKTLSVELNRLIENSELRINLSTAARVRVQNAFGMERMVKELEELYISYRFPVTDNLEPEIRN
jgi:L-malate glycosyltransferase